MNNISCLLFDLDGTLFDSSEANVHAYKQAFEHVGLAFDEATYRSNFGLRFDEILAHLAPSATDEQKATIQEQKVIFYKNCLDLVKPNDGLLMLLSSIRSQFKTALVTTARSENVMNLLNHFAVNTSLFDLIITADDVAHGKPDPECYNTAMTKLGVQPEDCCIFEDSDVGMQAALAAGVKVIRVQI